MNYLIGLLHGNFGLGMSYGWWSHKHNRHHANPNRVGKDPDVGAGALVWTAAQARQRHGSARWLARHQAALYFPLLLLEGVNLKVSSAIFLARTRRRGRGPEFSLIAAHYAITFTLLFLALSPAQAIVFWLVQQALIGLHLGCAFAPNHKGMPMPGERWDYLRRQVLTSRNVRGGHVADWLLGGLNYQIEHHLFPNMPRANLRRARPLVREHCSAVGVAYTETGFIASYRQALQYMHEVGSGAMTTLGTDGPPLHGPADPG